MGGGHKILIFVLKSRFLSFKSLLFGENSFFESSVKMIFSGTVPVNLLRFLSPFLARLWKGISGSFYVLSPLGPGTLIRAEVILHFVSSFIIFLNF